MSILLLSSDVIFNKVFLATTNEFSLKTIVVTDLTGAINHIKNGIVKVIVVNIPLISESCPKKITKMIQESNPYIPFYFLIDQMDFSQAITLTKLGAEYCYSKPFALKAIVENIEKTLNTLSALEINNINEYIEQKYVSGKSKQACALYKQIDTVADTNFSVIIYGETGTGKESVAHRLSNGIYKNKPIVAVDCGCLNKELAGSELFGHKKGSFSGAFEDKVGAFEFANNGTIFLDEIGNLDYSVQVLLLRAIEEKKIKRIGSNIEIPINVRILAASNEKLSDAVARGDFREDLFYRLNEFEINIPPLRDRIEDLELFINYFISQANNDLNKSISGVESNLMEKFLSYDWPGNIRELKNVIRRGCLMASKKITKECLSEDFINKLITSTKGKKFDNLLSSSNLSTSEDLKYKSALAEFEEIHRVLKEEKYNKTKTALRLNINRKTLYNKIKLYNQISYKSNQIEF